MYGYECFFYIVYFMRDISHPHQLGYCIDAVNLGVNRAHIVSASDGALLKEIFTPIGSGLLVTKNIYDGIRNATESDLQDILVRTTADTMFSHSSFNVYQPLHTWWSNFEYYTPKNIISPLIETGELKERSRKKLKNYLKHFTVTVRGGKLLACAFLKQYSSSHAEIGSLAVHPLARHNGLGEV